MKTFSLICLLETAETTLKAAQALDELVKNYVNIDKKISIIEEIEHECDNHIHKIMQEINKSFITPIDREDICAIAKEMDNITDSIESTAHRFKMFNIKSIKEDAIKLVKLIVDCTLDLKSVMVEFKNDS